MFRHLTEVATEIGMTGLARLLEITFRDDIRNATAHADYILAQECLRVRRRNGGNPILVSNAEVEVAFQITMFFFELLQAFQQKTAESFRPARTIIGRFSNNPPMPWKIELTADGRFSISSDTPGPQVDAAYERQKRINDHLGGKMVTAYVGPGINAPPALLSEVAQIGFEILIVGFESADRFAALVAEVRAKIVGPGFRPREHRQHPSSWLHLPDSDGLLAAQSSGFGFLSLMRSSSVDLSPFPPVQ